MRGVWGAHIHATLPDSRAMSNSQDRGHFGARGTGTMPSGSRGPGMPPAPFHTVCLSQVAATRSSVLRFLLKVTEPNLLLCAHYIPQAKRTAKEPLGHASEVTHASAHAVPPAGPGPALPDPDNHHVWFVKARVGLAAQELVTP